MASAHRSFALRAVLVTALCTGCATDPALTEPAVDGGRAPDANLAIEPDYGRLFPLDRVVEVALDFEDGGWASLLAAPLENDYFPARLTYDGVVLDRVGVRFKGNSSRWSVEELGSTRYSLKVDLDLYAEGQTLFGVDKINFNNGYNDPTQLREVISTELFAGAELPSPQMGFARISIDGALHGLYVALEEVDKEFLRRHFSDDDGDLYKPEPPAGNLAWMGQEIGAYDGMEIETNETTTDHRALLHFLDVLNHTATESLETALAEVFDVDGFLRYLAVSALHVNLDSILGPGHNYYLYEDRSSGRFVLIPWDMNGTFGCFTCNLTPAELVAYPYDQPACPPAGAKILIARVLGVPAFRARYQEYLAEYAAGHVAAEEVSARVFELADVLRPYVAEDPTRFFTSAEFEANLTSDLPRGPSRVFFGLTSFLSRRIAELEEQLDPS